MAKKTSKTKKPKGRKQASASNVTHIYYECQGNSCVESIHSANVGNGGSIVVLSAIGTDVQLDFKPFLGSPFKGGQKKISIRAGKSKHMVVDQSAAHQSYPYKLSCAACTSAPPPGPPEMIVP